MTHLYLVRIHRILSSESQQFVFKHFENIEKYFKDCEISISKVECPDIVENIESNCTRDRSVPDEIIRESKEN